MLRVVLAVLAVLVVGCHGTDLRVGTGYTDGEGGSSGSSSSSGWKGSSSSFDVENGDATSVWAELGFQLTPQTVVVQRADDHFLEPLYPPMDPPADDQPSRGGASDARVAARVVPADTSPPAADPVIGTRSYVRLEARVLSLEARVEALEEDHSEERSGLASIDWTEIIIAFVVLVLGGGAVTHRVRKGRRDRRAARADRPPPKAGS